LAITVEKKNKMLPTEIFKTLPTKVFFLRRNSQKSIEVHVGEEMTPRVLQQHCNSTATALTVALQQHLLLGGSYGHVHKAQAARFVK